MNISPLFYPVRHVLILASLGFACLSALPAQAGIVIDPPAPAALPLQGAASPLVALDYSPDGKTIYTVGNDGELLARDTKTTAIEFHGTLGSGVSHLRVLDDGSLLIGRSSSVIERYAKPRAGRPLKIVATLNSPEAEAQNRDNKPLHDLHLGGFSLAPDGITLAVATLETGYKPNPSAQNPVPGRFPTPPQRGESTARVRLWNLKTGTITREITTYPGTFELPPKLAWRDKKTLVVALPALTIQRFDSETGKLESEWKPPADIKFLIAGDQKEEMARRTRNLPPSIKARIEQGESTMKAVRPNDAGFGTINAISDDGNLFITSGRVSGLYLWDIRYNFCKLLEKADRLPQAEEAQFSNDGELVAVRNGGGFWLWKTNGFQLGWARIPFGEYSGLAFSPKSADVALADANGFTRIWGTTSDGQWPKTPQTAIPGFFRPWIQLASTPSGLLGATKNGVAAMDASGVRWFDNIPLDSPAPIPPTLLIQPRQEVIAITPSSDGKTWAESVTLTNYSTNLSSRNIPHGELRVRDVQTGNILWRATDRDINSTIKNFLFLPEGTLMSAKESNSPMYTKPNNWLSQIQGRDVNTGELKPLNIDWGFQSGGSPLGSEFLEMSADGRTLVFSDGMSGVKVIDIPSRRVRCVVGPSHTLFRAQWSISANGQWLVTTYGHSLKLWDVSTTRDSDKFRPDLELPLPPSATPTDLKFGASGVLAVGLTDGRVLAWSAPFTPQTPPTWETMAGRAVLSLAFSQDGKVLYCGDERGDLKSRNAQTGILLDTLRLLPPQNESSNPSWVKWNAAGTITKSTP